MAFLREACLWRYCSDPQTLSDLSWLGNTNGKVMGGDYILCQEENFCFINLSFLLNFVTGSLEEGELSEEELEQKRKALLRELQENS